MVIMLAKGTDTQTLHPGKILNYKIKSVWTFTAKLLKKYILTRWAVIGGEKEYKGFELIY